MASTVRVLCVLILITAIVYVESKITTTTPRWRDRRLNYTTRNATKKVTTTTRRSITKASPQIIYWTSSPRPSIRTTTRRVTAKTTTRRIQTTRRVTTPQYAQDYGDQIYVPRFANNHPIPEKHLHRYQYSPPTQVEYTVPGRPLGHYPVYTEQLPRYVYEYRASGSKYRKLLAGLGLYNLGLVSNNHRSKEFHRKYTPDPNEICKFGVSHDNTVDEMDIDCRLITDYIATQRIQMDQTKLFEKPLMHPNGTLVHVSSAHEFIRSLRNEYDFQVPMSQTQLLLPNGTVIEGAPVINAMDPRFDGASVNIRSDWHCYIKWIFYRTTRSEFVDCGLLQKYVDMSLNSAVMMTSALSMIVFNLVIIIYGEFY